MSLKERFELVIFDWAGTMIDFGCEAPVKALIEAFAAEGVAIDAATARRDMGKAKSDHVQSLFMDPALAAAWRARHGRLAAPGDIDALIARLGPLMREHAVRASRLIPGARETRSGACGVFGRDAGRPAHAADDLQGLCGSGGMAVVARRQSR